MKKIILLLIIALSSMGVGFAQQAKKSAKKQEVVEFKMDEVLCQHCRKKIDNNIAFEKGVTDIVYSEDGTSVQVTYRTDKTNPDKLLSAFKRVKLNVVEMTPQTKDRKKEDKKKD